MKELTQDFIVKPFQVDFVGRASLTTIGDLLFEIAGMHADKLGYGVRSLLKQGKVWFLTRISIQMSKYPGAYEKITIKTWINSIESIFTSRCFEIIRGTEVIGVVHTSWAMIDLKTRKPVYLPEFLDKAVINEKECTAKSASKLSPTQSSRIAKTDHVKYSDMDLNFHVTSMRYLQWMIDLFPVSLFKQKILHGIQMNYLSELRFGDHYDLILKEIIDQTLYKIEVRNSQTNEPSCIGKLEWIDV